jgi:hypothetical protein
VHAGAQTGAHRRLAAAGPLNIMLVPSTARKEKEESAARTESTRTKRAGRSGFCSEFNFAGEAARERRDEGGTARGRELQRSTMADADERRTTRQRGAVR